MKFRLISAWTGEHHDPAVEEAFRRSRLEVRRRQARHIVLAASIVFFAFIVSDLANEGWTAAVAVKSACRLLVLVAGVAFFLGGDRAATSGALNAWLAGWHVLIAAAATVIFALTAPSSETARVAAIFMVLVAYLAVPLPFVLKTALTAGASAAFAAALWFPAAPGVALAEFLVMLAAANIFGAIAAAAGNRMQRQQHQAWLAERAAARAQARSDELLDRLFESAPTPLLISTVADGSILRLNRAALDLAGWDSGPPPGLSTEDFYVDPEARSRLVAALREQPSLTGFETQLHLDDRVTDVLIGASLITYGGEECLMSGVTDITPQKRLEAELRRMAVTDQLTGLFNRHYFFIEGGKAIERARRYGRPLAVLMMDLDHFKAVNDTHGHEAGDATLRVFADRCHEVLREADTMARFGGEEFVVLLPETNLAGAAVLAERLRAAVAAEPVRYEKVDVPITVSVGATAVATEAERLDDAVARADRALMRAKRAGRNQVVVVDFDG